MFVSSSAYDALLAKVVTGMIAERSEGGFIQSVISLLACPLDPRAANRAGVLAWCGSTTPPESFPPEKDGAQIDA